MTVMNVGRINCIKYGTKLTLIYSVSSYTSTKCKHIEKYVVLSVLNVLR